MLAFFEEQEGKPDCSTGRQRSPESKQPFQFSSVQISNMFGVVVMSGGWSKGILEFCFGPNFGLGLKTETELNNMSVSKIRAVFVFHNYLMYAQYSYFTCCCCTCMFPIMEERMSTGTGNTMVLLFSADMLLRVWR